jgi:hypothetical protein
MFAMTIHLAVIASGFCVAISQMLLGDCFTGKSSHVRNDTSSCCHCERFSRSNLPPGDQGIAALAKAAMFAMTLHLAVIASGFCEAISHQAIRGLQHWQKQPCSQ